MRPVFSSLPMLLPALLGLASCAAQPPATQVFISGTQPAIVPLAPAPPPPPIAELVPPPPPSSTPTIWQPGHWSYTGVSSNPWSWVAGMYVGVPSGAHAWVPGVWQQQGGGFVWQEGHWA